MPAAWLILDIGNSAVKWGQFADSGSLTHTGRLAFSPSQGDAKAWRTALQSDAIPEAQRVGIVSVVPQATQHAQLAIEAQFARPAQVLRVEGPLPFAMRYDTPHTLGTDRLAAAAAAWYAHDPAHRRSVLAIDAGTALTIEVIDNTPAYRGGVIAPGPHLLRDALATGGAQLPAVDLTAPPHPIGNSTEHALQSGIVHGFAAMASGLVEQLANTLSDTPYMALTGGAASLLHDALPRVDTHDPHLVLRGAYQLLRYRARHE
ncbi:type III pantothenate kinase [Longimonas halophila]|uniref:Type III pantothenate kinase n=1 Tax=Longimonas halophila TaxID=1469170 RepID=A0A2H3NI42_9BACT|nr:type III pantothenate kinase [Longimonas halophila]PEN05005.1 type III pantothenate kinase [Longimonas halophila]